MTMKMMSVRVDLGDDEDVTLLSRRISPYLPHVQK